MNPVLHPLLIRVARRVTGIRVKSHARFRSATESKKGLEIGGPSGAFRDSGILPLYKHVSFLDNCVFSTTTTWEGTRSGGRTFQFHTGKPFGFNYIREATDLAGIPDQSYDFVLSAHNLEHVANPLKALKEWRRVLRPGGSLIVILPNYRNTFDHRRQPTPIEHMIDDFTRNTDEHDLTHLQEVLELHDLSRDPGCKSEKDLKERALANFENRCIHHHVFDESNSADLLRAAGFRVEVVEKVRPHHIVLLAA